MRLNVRIGFLLAGVAFALQAPARAEDDPFSAANAVDPARLDELRGGFNTDSGLTVSLGLERIVTINGTVVERSQLDLGDLGRLTSGQATLSPDAVGQLRLIQNGAGSDFDVQLGSNALGGTVIQNSLNNQLINNQTIINASVNARGLLQALNFQASLANALTTAATGR